MYGNRVSLSKSGCHYFIPPLIVNQVNNVLQPEMLKNRGSLYQTQPSNPAFSLVLIDLIPTTAQHAPQVITGVDLVPTTAQLETSILSTQATTRKSAPDQTQISDVTFQHFSAMSTNQSGCSPVKGLIWTFYGIKNYFVLLIMQKQDLFFIATD